MSQGDVASFVSVLAVPPTAGGKSLKVEDGKYQFGIIKSLTGGSILSMRVACYPGLVRYFPDVPNRSKVENIPGFDSSGYQFPEFKVKGSI